MKEFIVNTHKLCTVECDIPMNICPVTQMLLDHRTKTADSESCSVYNKPDTKRTYVCAQTRDARNLKHAIMEMCMECNIQGR